MLAFYEKAIEGIFAADDEVWKQDHGGAIQCLEFEKVVLQTTETYDRVIEAFDAWYDAAVGGEGLEDKAMCDRWRSLFREMEKCFSQLLSRLSRYEGQGYAVSGDERLRECHTELTRNLSSHEHFFAGKAFEEFTRDAVAAHHRGETEPMTEFGA